MTKKFVIHSINNIDQSLYVDIFKETIIPLDLKKIEEMKKHMKDGIKLTFKNMIFT